MPRLTFTERDLMYSPFAMTDEDINREMYWSMRNAGNSEDCLIADAEGYRRATRGAGIDWFNRLWVMGHGGDGRPNLYSTGGVASRTAEELASDIRGLGYNGTPPEILVWSCYGGKPGGLVQQLYLHMRADFPRVRFSGFAGLTGAVQPGGEVDTVSQDFLNNTDTRAATTDSLKTRVWAEAGHLVTYPGTKVQWAEV